MTEHATPDSLPPLVREAIQSIVSYMWEDELDDICQQYEGDDDPADSGHIFCQLVTLDNWLNGTDHAVADLMDDHTDPPPRPTAVLTEQTRLEKLIFELEEDIKTINLIAARISTDGQARHYAQQIRMKETQLAAYRARLKLIQAEPVWPPQRVFGGEGG